MIFDSNGLPKDTGASDYADSARLAAMMVMVDHPLMTREKLLTYSLDNWFNGVRYPHEDPTGNKSSNNPKNYTRDQEICIAAALLKMSCPVPTLRLLGELRRRRYRGQNVEKDIPGSTKKFPDGADLFLPHHVNHMRICANENSLIIGKIFLAADVIFNAIFSPRRESNQILCMLMTAGPRWVKFYKLVTPQWKLAIEDYWCGWRNEPELAQMLIDKVKSM